MSYVVCIPSYNRPELCNEKTLTMLKENKITKSIIYVFVANKQEYDKYNSKLDKKLYHKLVIGKKGLVPQRQFIAEYFNHGKSIIFFDDDVEKIDLSLSPRFKSNNLDFFFKSAFKDCKKWKAFIWGAYPVFNPFFRKTKPELSTELKFIVGPFFGIINRPKLKEIQLKITVGNDQKEDVERTLKYFVHDGIVLRYNKVGFVTKYYATKSDYGTFEERMKPMAEAAKKLKEKYPEYGDISYKKTGMTEFKLKKIKASIISNSLQGSRTLKTKVNTKVKTRNKRKKAKSRRKTMKYKKLKD